MIEVINLEGLSIDEIKTIVNTESVKIEVYVPKKTQTYFSDPVSIAYDYANLAYAGQLLSDASVEFDYNFVIPEVHESVLFEITPIDRYKFSQVLFDIAGLYHSADDGLDVEEFLEQVELSEIECACPDFIEVYNEYINKKGDFDGESED